MTYREPTEDDPLCFAVRHATTALIWINEPKRRNPLSLQVRGPLISEVAAAMEDDEVRSVVIAGAGGCFCAGGDISGMTEMTGAQARKRMQIIHQLIRSIHSGPKPVIAAVEGWAIGAGLSLASACDIVVAATNARFSLPFGKIALMPDLGVLHTLPARIGVGRARWMALTGRTIDADTASRWGLVEETAEPGTVVAHALALADDIAQNAPLSNTVTKQMVARLPLSFEELLAAEADAQAMLFSTEDFVEGSRAFLEKRPPRFEGR